jgi:predicted nuclease of predicted toxin-antitoxin system
MRVLLDENIPHKLRDYLRHHEVFTVAFMRWRGVTNGKLLKLAEDDLFDVFVTADQNLEYQQNMINRRISVVFLTAQNWDVILPYMGDIVAAIDTASEGSHRKVQCGTFTRK